MRKLITVILVIFDFFLGCWYARAEAPFIYKGRGRRDPFVPLVTPDGKLRVTSTAIDSIDDIILEGIIYDPGRGSIVILNGIILKENDHVGSVKVKTIERDRVILICDNEEHILKLKE